MKTVLVISSFVAASRVGSTASAFCLRRLGHDVIVLPTTFMGRHPGWGDPGGGATPVEKLRDMWTAIKAQDIRIDAVLSGFMGERAHIDLTADIIADVTSHNPDAVILVDPVMGDDGRLYISEDRATAICDRLIPLANFITPNHWEFSFVKAHLGQSPICKTLITSVPQGEEIGALYKDGSNQFEVSHAKFDTVPHGGGDSLAGLFLGHILADIDPVMAMQLSVSGVYQMMKAANELDAGELPLVRTQDKWTQAKPLDVRQISHD